MKKPYLTLENIRRAVVFLEKRRVHAAGTDNDAWVDEFENAIRIIRGLCAFELLAETKEKDAVIREGR